MDRDFDWDGGINIRDLGSIPTEDGRKVRRGALIRSGGLQHLTDDGWKKLAASGVRTIIDLRNESERRAASYAPPDTAIDCLHLPLEEELDVSDVEFWREWRGLNCSPLYYSAYLNKYATRAGAVLNQIANARPGGVLFHCGIGRDRTGLLTLLLLKIVGASAESIIDDYSMSHERLRKLWDRLGLKNDEDQVIRLFEQRQTSASESIRSTLSEIDEVFLQKADVHSEQIALLHARALSP